MALLDFIKSLEKVRDSLDEDADKRAASKYAKEVDTILSEGISDFAQDLTNFIEELEGAKDNLGDASKDDRPEAINDLSQRIEDLIGLLEDHV